MWPYLLLISNVLKVPVKAPETGVKQYFWSTPGGAAHGDKSANSGFDSILKADDMKTGNFIIYGLNILSLLFAHI